jgi:hypothetical protein
MLSWARGDAVDEATWLTCADPDSLLRFLGENVSERKHRLFACASCRRVWERLPDARSREALDVVERFADGRASPEEIEAARHAADAAQQEAALARRYDHAEHAVWAATLLERSRFHGWGSPFSVAGQARLGAGDAACLNREAGVPNRKQRRGRAVSAMKREAVAQSEVLRDILGNPFRPAAVDPSWLTWRDGTIPKLAQAAYDERQLPAGTLDLARLAVLADALEEAGCTDEEMLGHLHGPGPHVRGCWVLDWLLGRE